MSFLRILLALVVLIIGATLHYWLPQVDVVRVVGGEIKRVDTTDAETGTQTSRDVYRIQAETLGGSPSVYRNEDALLFAKVDSAELQAQIQSLAADKSVVAIRHYGWRIPLFSMFPNAISAWPVEEDYRHIPVFNIAFLALLAGGVGWVTLRIRRASREREAERLRREEEAERARAAEEAKRQEEVRKDRADIDSFLNDDG